MPPRDDCLEPEGAARADGEALSESEGRRALARGPPAELPIIAIGASAGGLEAGSRLFDAISGLANRQAAGAEANAAGPKPPGLTGMAFLFVQHLDPTHQSLLARLLAEHTAMSVVEASEGLQLAADHVFVIPPGRDLSVCAGTLHLSAPDAHHGARLPFDFLLKSLAESCGPQTVAVILTGTGGDGSGGLEALREAGGHVIAQNPQEAEYAGMPRSAIQTGLVDEILDLADMPAALAARARIIGARGTGPEASAPHHQPQAPTSDQQASDEQASDQQASDPPAGMTEILTFLKETTAHDFSQYKAGTIGRRIERRMGLLSIRPGDLAGYLDLLRRKPDERELLAKDLLINVTSFFRDPKVFEALGRTVMPELINKLPAGHALRIWVAACSTGEEAYSMAMVCQDAIAAAGHAIKLQIFASDVDPDAIAVAREGLYSPDIANVVPADRLARYFTREEAGYRIAPSLRSLVVFTVQDVLTDPPFSRIDIVSCRNLLIYLNAEAQARAISLFHFALREGGILVLGSSETVGKSEDRFEVISQAERFYRHVARSRPGEPGFPFSFGEGLPRLTATNPEPPAARQSSLADICARALLADHAPAAVLINRQRQVVFSMGPTQRYLRVAPGYASHDLLAMVPPALRSKLKTAIEKAETTRARVTIGRLQPGAHAPATRFGIDIGPLGGDDRDLMLVCFVDEPVHGAAPPTIGSPAEATRIAELERELAASQAELQTAIQGQESSNQEQKAINEEALSVNEEFQSTNEELLTSKEELQSLNEELTALNSQLQETLDRQRLASDDLQNVLYSTNIATLFLDGALKIRFFTPAIRALFNLIPGDIGRPLADLASIAADGELLADAAKVLAGKVLAGKATAGTPVGTSTGTSTGTSIEREVMVPGGTWFLRRIFPYLTHSGAVEGVVITFADITEHKLADTALEVAKHEAERANAAKSRFLAAASHDLRQPLQSLTLLQGLLAQCVEGERPKKLLGRFEQTLRAMSGMLNALLDINQIEAGAVHPKPVVFAVSDLLERLRDEFGYMTQARGLALHVMATSARVESDPRLLEQMIRNLLGNAIKYTTEGRILLGCRRHGQFLRIEVYDTGIGIVAEELHAIFEEFHQVDNAARERSRGLGLGLSIVQRLGRLLGHDVDVRSIPGKGSVFAITVPLRADATAPLVRLPVVADGPHTGARHCCRIVVVDDDPDVLDLLSLSLKSDGYSVEVAADADAAMMLLADGAIRPEILLTDYNLPNGVNGLDLLGKYRAALGHKLPAIILTGDIGTATMAKIAAQDCIQLSKPVDPRELVLAIERLCPRAPPEPPPVATAIDPAPGPVSDPAPDPIPPGSSGAVTYVVDDDPEICSSLCELLAAQGHIARGFASAEDFLAAYRPGGEACLLVDAHLPGLSGVGLLAALRARGDHVPVVLITGDGDIGLAVDAMRTGACDFIEKPVGRAELLASITRAIDQSHDLRMLDAVNEDAAAHVSELTTRQHEVMTMVLAGHPSKNIAADLGISQRTVENHRAAIMHRLGVKSLPELARLALRAEGAGSAPQAVAKPGIFAPVG